MRGFAMHPALEDQLVIRHLELRHEDEDGLRLLRVVVSEGARVHGLSSSLYIGDEIWAWRGDELLEAMLTGLVKRPDARFLGISTAAARLGLGVRTDAGPGDGRHGGQEGRGDRRDGTGAAMAGMVACGGSRADGLPCDQVVQPGRPTSQSAR